MLNAIFIMSLGILLGVLIHEKKSIIQLSEKLTTYVIWLLLFLLGASIGANKIIIQNISTLGFQALMLSFSATAGSVFLAYFLYRYFFNHED